MRLFFRTCLLIAVVLAGNSCTMDENQQAQAAPLPASQQEAKQKKILEKFNALGLDPKDVQFTDTLRDSSNKIVLNSVDELENLFPDPQYATPELNSNAKKGGVDIPALNPLASGEGSAGSWDYWDYYNNPEITRFEQQIPVRGALFDIYFAFWYYRLYMETTSDQGIKSAQAGLLGYTLGVSYEMIEATYKRGAAPNYVKIYGLLHYNIFLEGVGTVYTRKCDIYGYFTPYKNNNNVGTFICALGS